MHRVHFLHFAIMIDSLECRNPFLNLANTGHAKSQGHELFDSGAKVVVPLEVRIRPISGIGMA